MTDWHCCQVWLLLWKKNKSSFYLLYKYIIIHWIAHIYLKPTVVLDAVYYLRHSTSSSSTGRLKLSLVMKQMKNFPMWFRDPGEPLYKCESIFVCFFWPQGCPNLPKQFLINCQQLIKNCLINCWQMQRSTQLFSFSNLIK